MQKDFLDPNQAGSSELKKQWTTKKKRRHEEEASGTENKSLENTPDMSTNVGEPSKFISEKKGDPSVSNKPMQADFEGNDYTMIDGMNDHHMELIKLKIMEEDTTDSHGKNLQSVFNKGVRAEDIDCVQETPGIWEEQVTDMNC